MLNRVVIQVVTNIQNRVIDKASKIIDIINLHLDESPACRHTLDEILEDIDGKKGAGAQPSADIAIHKIDNSTPILSQTRNCLNE